VLREVSPLTVIALRFGLGVLVLLGAVALSGEFVIIRGRDLGYLVLLGAIGVLVHQMLQANGLTRTSATHSGWLVALTPIFTALLAWLFLGERLTAARLAGIGLAFAGALWVVSRGQFNPEVLALPGTAGDFLLFLSAPNWAIFSVLSKPVLRRHPAILTMSYVLTLGWLMVLPLFLAGQGPAEIARLSLAGWGALAFLGLLCSGVAYIFWYDALQHGDASQVATFLYLEPLVTLAVAATLLGEPLTVATLGGGAVILAGVWLVNRPVKPV
jgi:drug/metabolite transporter (DMT)-like permease